MGSKKKEGSVDCLQEYSVNCYFRQKWTDERLVFEPIGNRSTLMLASKMLRDIWRPDTFIRNGRHSYLHTLTMPNILLRVSANGEVYISQRSPIFVTWFTKKNNSSECVNAQPLNFTQPHDFRYDIKKFTTFCGEAIRIRQTFFVSAPSMLPWIGLQNKYAITIYQRFIVDWQSKRSVLCTWANFQWIRKRAL